MTLFPEGRQTFAIKAARLSAPLELALDQCWALFSTAECCGLAPMLSNVMTSPSSCVNHYSLMSCFYPIWQPRTTHSPSLTAPPVGLGRESEG